MDIAKIETTEQLKQLGSIEEIRRKLEEIVSPLQVGATTYAGLMDVVRILQKNWLGFHAGPFVSRQAELVFYLTRLDGEQRNKLLEITDAHYRDKDLARKWFRSLRQQVHSDRGGDDAAFLILQELYDVMTESGEGDGGGDD